LLPLAVGWAQASVQSSSFMVAVCLVPRHGSNPVIPLASARFRNAWTAPWGSPRPRLAWFAQRDRPAGRGIGTVAPQV